MERNYRLADVIIRVETVFEAVHRMCAGYAVSLPAALEVRTDRDDIAYERGRASLPGCSDAYLETLAVYRKIAEAMPGFDAFLFHGSAVAVDGQAYVFAAASGTGKSTHARLWRELLGERVVMINDDKPLVRVCADGSARVYGTPWDGKHHLSANTSAPLRAVCLLERGAENAIRPVDKAEAMPMLLRQTYRPADPDALVRTLALLDRLDVRLYRLRCNMDLSAAELSYRTMREK